MLTQVNGDVAEAPAGRLSEDAPTLPVTPYGSEPLTRCAPPLSVQPESEPSKSPPATSW